MKDFLVILSKEKADDQEVVSSNQEDTRWKPIFHDKLFDLLFVLRMKYFKRGRDGHILNTLSASITLKIQMRDHCIQRQTFNTLYPLLVHLITESIFSAFYKRFNFYIYSQIA